MERDIVAIIMAGGLGTRMNSNIPKVLHNICSIPMIVHIIFNLQEFSKYRNLKQICIIVGKYKEEIKTTIENYVKLPYITYIEQNEPKGTGHAIKCCSDCLLQYKDCDSIILSGDVPLFSYSSMISLTNNLNKARIVITEVDNPTGYGRIVINNNIFVRIKEHNECSTEELKIKKINCGIYSFNVEILLKWINCIKNDNSKKEYYLTDIIELIQFGEKIDIDTFEISTENQHEIMGVNTIEQLHILEEKFLK
jgi:bifunctional N-acetylglucosamine-1-phosphate-uridyltransferase/glucosamine-1-phosphate-acetyltransferase GlmU-like protein